MHLQAASTHQSKIIKGLNPTPESQLALHCLYADNSCRLQLVIYLHAHSPQTS